MSEVKVSIPSQLRSLTGGRAQVPASGRNVAEVLEQLDSLYPGLAERVLDDHGKVRRFLNIYVDDEDIRFLEGLATELPEGARLAIIPSVAGGRS